MNISGYVRNSRSLILFITLLYLLCATVIGFGAETPAAGKGVYRVMVGDFAVITLSDGIAKRPVEQQLALLFGDKEKMRSSLAAAYPDGQMESTVNAFLIKAGAKLILVDAGNGKQGNPVMGQVIDNLRAAGYQPEQITDIYLTHMHGDHIGGLLLAEERAFPNATVYAHQREAEYWLSDANLNAAPENAKRGFQTAKRVLTPYINAGKFKTFAENEQLTAGITAKAFFGHTPGHTAFLVENKGDSLILWGDIVHVAAVQFADPAVTISYDTNRPEAAAARQQILAEAAKHNWLIGGAHLMFPAVGRVQTSEAGGYVWLPLNP